MENMFRKLRADEVEVRQGNSNKDKTGCSLLLYKSARADMAILDETVGPMSWCRSHEVIGGGLFCSIGIKDEVDKNWVFKSDAGTEGQSKPDQAIKGKASDAFKRAATNWGIGRELYTAPFIWVSPMPGAFDKFACSEIGYDEHGSINHLIIINTKSKQVIYNMSNPYGGAGNKQYNNSNSNGNTGNTQAQAHTLSEKQVGRLFAMAKTAGISNERINEIIVANGVTEAKLLSKQNYDGLCNKLQERIDSLAEQGPLQEEVSI